MVPHAQAPRYRPHPCEQRPVQATTAEECAGAGAEGPKGPCGPEGQSGRKVWVTGGPGRWGENHSHPQPASARQLQGTSLVTARCSARYWLFIGHPPRSGKPLACGLPGLG